MIRNERRKINKRKRNILKSISSISIHRQPLIKKLKKQNTRITSTTTTAVANNSYYRQPKYLKWSTFMLFRLLKQMFNYLFKKKSHKSFIRTRLNLLDQQYFSELHLQLWESYLKIGLEQHRWPVNIL